MFEIGDWIFSPASNELIRGEVRRRLEDRAARTLELLCRNRGTIVSQNDILLEIWSGRAISPNSVPVVISDIRQALGDNARIPRHIETVAKRGYRLMAGAIPISLPSRTTRGTRSGRLRWIILAALIISLALTLGVRSAGDVTVVVTDVENATGRPELDPLARAASDVILLNAKRISGVRVSRNETGFRLARRVILRSRLILWSGKPTVMLSAESGSGTVIWTGMTSGGEDDIPRDIARAVKTLATAIERRSD